MIKKKRAVIKYIIEVTGFILLVYGEKGVPNITNAPGGRSEAIGWCDGTTKELWIFGGKKAMMVIH